MKLEELQVDTQVLGIEPMGSVKLLYVQKAGPESVNVTYELPNGQLLKKALFRSDEARLAVAGAARLWTFDGAPAAFKLAAEATRIRLAHLFDPMMAVHTSDVDPLPHQIAAVYETMLLKQPACRLATVSPELVRLGDPTAPYLRWPIPSPYGPA